MDGLKLSRRLCYFFCCPPCPSRIAAKLTFFPPEPSYSFKPDQAGSKYVINFTEEAKWKYSDKEKQNLEGLYARTDRGNTIACLFVRCHVNAQYTILFSNGSATDLGRMSSFYFELGSTMNCNIFSYDYSGYGISSGNPSEKNLYADIDAACHALETNYNICLENIILYGQSIGSVPTIDLASRCEVGAVIWHSALKSGMPTVFPYSKRNWFFDVFKSIDKVPRVTSPVLVIHGTMDKVVDFSHGLDIYKSCQRVFKPLFIKGAGHNNVENHREYSERLEQFVEIELGAGKFIQRNVQKSTSDTYIFSKNKWPKRPAPKKIS